MKIKPLYIYIGVFAAFILAFVLFSDSGKQSAESTDQMPNDAIHQGMGGSGDPSASNVTSETRSKFDNLRTSYEKNPADTVVAKDYALMLAMAHQPEKAIEILENILKTGPNRSDILLELTFLYFNKGEIDKAENFTKRMLKIDANDQYAVYNLGIIAHSKGDLATAKKQFEETIKKFPGEQVASDAKMLLEELEKTKK